MTPRDEWLLMSNMLLPPVYDSETTEDSARDHTQYNLDLARNIKLTARAVKMGLALSALDGPLPVMDIVAFAGVSIYTTILWGNFYLDYY